MVLVLEEGLISSITRNCVLKCNLNSVPHAGEVPQRILDQTRRTNAEGPKPTSFSTSLNQILIRGPVCIGGSRAASSTQHNKNKVSLFLSRLI